MTIAMMHDVNVEEVHVVNGANFAREHEDKALRISVDLASGL